MIDSILLCSIIIVNKNERWRTHMLNKEDVIQNKKIAIKSLNKLLETCINSGDMKLLKKANLLSYWMKTFSDYISFEDSFDSRKLISYSRGNVIRVNFGFNVGKELGGLHFAVVLDNDNKQSADVLTVVPLSSTDGRTVHQRSVDLGMELYEKVKSTQEALLKSAKAELAEIQKVQETLVETLKLVSSQETIDGDKEQLTAVSKFLDYKKEIEEKSKALESELKIIERNNAEIAKMKSGSMAVINQITTVSKQRVFTPKKSQDFLYGISLSTSAMEKINVKIQELFCR